MKKSRSIFAKSGLFLIAIVMMTSCQKDPLEFEWTESSNLQQTEWIINRYDNTMTNLSEFPGDTLYFINENSYQINGGAAREYSLRIYEIGEENEYQLVLNDCSTFGGDFWSWIDQFSIDEGELANKLFQNGTDNDIVVWMDRIQ